jgi:NAD-dependent deacetylase
MMEFDARLFDGLRNAAHIVVFTGAGASAESGIPTFRDKQTGLWQKFDPAELATPGAFRADPSLVWGWYESRRATVLRAKPNGAHEAIAAMAQQVPRLTLITQNVDDLHERAGSRDVLHLHGELAHPYCEGCRRRYDFPTPGSPAPGAGSAAPGGGSRREPPRCISCGGRIRPGVVWFGESLPREVWQASCQAARQAHVFFCVGTSSVVQPAASLTALAIEAGAMTVQINPNPTAMDDDVTLTYRGPAGVILPRMIEQAWPNLATRSP